MDQLKEFALAFSFAVAALLARVSPFLPADVALGAAYFALSMSAIFWLRAWLVAPIVRAIDALRLSTSPRPRQG